MSKPPIPAARAAKVAILAAMLAAAPAMADTGSRPVAAVVPSAAIGSTTAVAPATWTPTEGSLAMSATLNCARRGTRMVC